MSPFLISFSFSFSFLHYKKKRGGLIFEDLISFRFRKSVQIFLLENETEAFQDGSPPFLLFLISVSWMNLLNDQFVFKFVCFGGYSGELSNSQANEISQELCFSIVSFMDKTLIRKISFIARSKQEKHMWVQSISKAIENPPQESLIQDVFFSFYLFITNIIF